MSEENQSQNKYEASSGNHFNTAGDVFNINGFPHEPHGHDSDNLISFDEIISQKRISSTGNELKVANDGSISPAYTTKVFNKVKEFIPHVENSDQVRQIENFIKKVESILIDYGDEELPEFFVAQAEDGTIGLTWEIDDSKIGIGFAPNEEDSSWFILSGEKARGVTAFGNFSKFYETNFLLNWVINFAEKIKNRG